MRHEFTDYILVSSRSKSTKREDYVAELSPASAVSLSAYLHVEGFSHCKCLLERTLWLLVFLKPPISFPERISVSQPHVKLLHFLTPQTLFPSLISCYSFTISALLSEELITFSVMLFETETTCLLKEIFHSRFQLFTSSSLLFLPYSSKIKERFVSSFFFFVPHDVDVYVSLDNITRSSSRSHERGDCWKKDANI